MKTSAARSALWGLGFLGLLSADALGQTADERYAIGFTGHGGLAQIDGHLFFTNSQELGVESIWRLKDADKGRKTIRGMGGYLTVDKEGGLTLTKEPEDGSYWTVRISGLGATETGVVNVNGEVGRGLTADDKATTFTDKRGKAHEVHRARLTRDGEKTPFFLVSVISG